MSIPELRVRAILCELFPGERVEYNARPGWLRNPKTGKPMEFDIWYPDKDIAFEYNGWQHYKAVPRQGVWKGEVQAQWERDRQKYRIAQEHGIRVFTILAKHLNGLKPLVGIIKEWLDDPQYKPEQPRKVFVSPWTREGRLDWEDHKPAPTKKELALISLHEKHPPFISHVLTEYEKKVLYDKEPAGASLLKHGAVPARGFRNRRDRRKVNMKSHVLRAPSMAS